MTTICELYLFCHHKQVENHDCSSYSHLHRDNSINFFDESSPDSFILKCGESILRLKFIPFSSLVIHFNALLLKLVIEQALSILDCCVSNSWLKMLLNSPC